MKLPTISQRSLRIFGFLMLVTLPGQILLGASLTPTTSCTIDGLPAPCMPGNPASTLLTYNDGIGSNFISLMVSADVTAGEMSNVSALAGIDLTVYVTTAGPVRPGFATFTIFTDNEESPESDRAGAWSAAGVAGLPSCAGKMCGESGDLIPFTLGVVFGINMEANANATASLDQPVLSASATAGIDLALWELAQDGSLIPVNILGPVPVPEPNQFGMALLTALACIAWNVLSRRKLRRNNRIMRGFLPN